MSSEPNLPLIPKVGPSPSTKNYSCDCLTYICENDKYLKSTTDTSVIMCDKIISVFKVYYRKKLLTYLKQDWVKPKAGGLGGGAVSLTAGPRQSHKLWHNHEILEKTIIFNHNTGQMQATWRIQCFIKQ